jgi:hypothetical protein
MVSKWRSKYRRRKQHQQYQRVGRWHHGSGDDGGASLAALAALSISRTGALAQKRMASTAINNQ